MMINSVTEQNILDLNHSIETSRGRQEPVIGKFRATLQPGKTTYDIRHRLGTVDVIVQTRIDGRIREGGISIVDANCVRLTFGGTLNESIDVVIIG